MRPHVQHAGTRQPPPDAAGRRGRRAALTAALLGLAAYATARIAGVAHGGVLPDVLLGAVFALTSATCLIGLRSRGSERGIWALLALAIASYGATALTYTIDPGVAARFPSVADFGLFAFYPLAVAALVLLVRSRFPGLGPTLWLDAAIGGFAVAALATQTIRAAVPAHLDLATLGQLLYAACDFMFLGFLASTCALSIRRPPLMLAWLGLGAAVLAVGDTTFAIQAAGGRGASLVPQLCWPAGMLLMSASAVPRARIAEAATRDVRGMAVIPLIGSIVLIPIALLTDVGHPAVLAFAAAGLCAVVIRLTRGLAENARLAARVQRDLETLTEAERLVREASEERDAILNAAADGIYRVDGEGRLTFVNTAAASMLGWEADDLLGRDAHEVLHPPGFGGCRGPREECPTAGSAAGHRAHRSDDGLLARRDGTALPVSYVSTPLVTESTGSGAVCVFTDVTERKRTEAERDELLLRVHTLALTDELTELPNRRAWDVALGRELARATRTPVPLCVAMVDLDGLKAINDAHGHQAGSAAIKRAAAAWSGALRDCDLIARFGGDEFAALLPYSTLEQARVVGDRLRSSLGRHPTASIGIAQWEHGESAESVVGRADAALYEAKRRGRDRTVLAPPRSEPDGSGAQRVPGAAAGR